MYIYLQNKLTQRVKHLHDAVVPDFMLKVALGVPRGLVRGDEVAGDVISQRLDAPLLMILDEV